MSDWEIKESYSRIISTANAIKKAIGTRATNHQDASETCGPWDDIYPCFRPASEIADILISDGLSSSLARKLADTVQRSLACLQAELWTKFNKAWDEVICLPTKSDEQSLTSFRIQICKAYEAVYDRKAKAWIESTRKLALTRLHEMGAPNRDAERNKWSSKAGRPAFRQAFLPILEACFTKNPTPSREDKSLLAERTGMSYKQIHVWFQNRRSRLKKANEPLRKAASSAKPAKASAPNSALSSGRRKATSRLSSAIPVKSVDIESANETPAYAYPASYPPVIEKDPFPCRYGDFSCFPILGWARHPVTKSRGSSSSEVDVNALCLSFASLNISDAPLQDEGSRGKKSQSSSNKSVCDVTSFYTVRPLRAPLLSLVREKPRDSPDCADDEPSTDAAIDTTYRGSQSSQLAQRKARIRYDRRTKTRVILEIRDRLTPVSHSSKSRKSPKEKLGHQRSRRKRASVRTKSSAPTDNHEGRETPLQQSVEQMPPMSYYPSPPPSIDSLPSLSHSSGGSSTTSSVYSLSPTTAPVALSGIEHSEPVECCQRDNSCLTLPPSFSDSYQLPLVASGFAFDFLKGSDDYLTDVDSSSFRSYSDSFESIFEGLQAIPDFSPSSVRFDLLCFP